MRVDGSVDGSVNSCVGLMGDSIGAGVNIGVSRGMKIRENRESKIMSRFDAGLVRDKSKLSANVSSDLVVGDQPKRQSGTKIQPSTMQSYCICA